MGQHGTVGAIGRLGVLSGSVFRSPFGPSDRGGAGVDAHCGIDLDWSAQAGAACGKLV